MSTNFAKTLVWKQDYDIILWRHKQRTPNTNDYPMPLNETPPMKSFCVRHCHWRIEFASEAKRLVYVAESLLEIQLWRRSCDSREKVGLRKKTAIAQERISAKSPTHLVFLWCLLYGAQVVIPAKLRQQVLDLLHECHFGINGWSSWPFTGRTSIPTFSIYAGNVRFAPGISPNSWMLPEKPWSGLHIDHAINFLSITQRSQYQRSQQSIVVTDCAAIFKSNEFQEFCKVNVIVHLTGAPYHLPPTAPLNVWCKLSNKRLKKSAKAPKDALQDFLITVALVYQPNAKRIATDVKSVLILKPYCLHLLTLPRDQVSTVWASAPHNSSSGYVQGRRSILCPLFWTTTRSWPYMGACHFGTGRVNLRVVPRGSVWRRHIDQLQRRYVSTDDTEPGDFPRLSEGRREPLRFRAHFDSGHQATVNFTSR